MTAPADGRRRSGTAPRPEIADPDGDRPADLRLVAVAAGTWLSALVALSLSTPAALAVGGAAAGLAAAVSVASRRAAVSVASRRAAVAGALLAVLLGAVCGAVATAPRLAARDAVAVAGPARERAVVTAELTVRGDPHRLPGDPGRPATYLIPAWLDRLTAPGAAPVRVRARVLVFGDHAWAALVPGQPVAAEGRLGPSRGGDLTAAVFSAREPPRPMGEPPWHQRAAGALRAGLQRACATLAPEPGGLLPGLVVGDTSRLDPAVADDFVATGMTHLVAVSGSNVAIIVGFVLLLARAARAGPRLSAGVCLLALAGFVILARPEPSVIRAGVMGAIALVALATGRGRAALPALAATVTLLVIADPQLARDPGFALSVLATGGLLLVAPAWRDALRRRGVPPGLAEALAIPAAAQAVCAPVVAGLSGTVSLVAVAANLLAAPAVAPATILGVLTAVAAPVWPAAAEFGAWLAGWPAGWLVLVARHGAQVPGAVLPWPAGPGGAVLLAAVTVALLAAARRRWVRYAAAVVATATVLGAMPVRLLADGWPPPGLLVAACAVGQGDLVVLPAGAGQAVVVDAGPDPAAADRCLRDLGIRAVPLLVISHFHADHVAGLAGVFRGRPVAAVVVPAWPEPAAARRAAEDLAARHGARVHKALAGAAYRAGDVSVTVLGPPSALTGTRSDPNNNSLVLRARVRGATVLLPGDAEVELQRSLLTRYGAAGLRADVLKVAHHGSSYQDDGFLDAADPAVALIPVGAGNDYGHPSPALVERLRRGGARVLRTDTDGDIAAVRHGAGLAVVARAPPPSARTGS